MRRVLRYELDVDDRAHAIGDGPVLLGHAWRQAAGSPAGRVEVWVEVPVPTDWPSVCEPTRQVQVFRTGQEIPDRAVWLASCLDGSLVWHIYEIDGDLG